MDTTLSRIKEQIEKACIFMLDESSISFGAIEEQAEAKRADIDARCKRMQESGYFTDSELSDLCGYAEKIFAQLYQKAREYAKAKGREAFEF